MSRSPRKPRRIARLSLLNLVLLTTIVALGFGLLASGRRNAELDARNDQLAAENKAFRNELGIFEVEDPTKTHTIRVPRNDNEPHKYRVYLPKGYRYTQCYKVGGIPISGVPERIHAMPVEPGHYLFAVDIERQQHQATGTERYVSVKLKRESTDDVNSSSQITVSAPDWSVNERTGQVAHTLLGPSDKLELHDPAEPLVLYRDWAQEIEVLEADAEGRPTRWRTEPILGEADGFMLWIESERLDQQAE